MRNMWWYTDDIYINPNQGDEMIRSQKDWQDALSCAAYLVLGAIFTSGIIFGMAGVLVVQWIW